MRNGSLPSGGSSSSVGAVAGVSEVRAVPSLDELAAHPERAGDLPAAVASDLLRSCEAQLARYQGLRDLLLIRIAVGANGAGRSLQPDLFDDIAEAARLIGRTPHFIYRNHRALPFAIQEGKGRRLRFSRSAIERFLRERQGAAPNGNPHRRPPEFPYASLS